MGKERTSRNPAKHRSPEHLYCSSKKWIRLLSAHLQKKVCWLFCWLTTYNLKWSVRKTYLTVIMLISDLSPPQRFLLYCMEIGDIEARRGRQQGGEGEGKLPPFPPSHHSLRAPFLSHLSPPRASAEERDLRLIELQLTTCALKISNRVPRNFLDDSRDDLFNCSWRKS